jgi:hypothetical protein
MSTITPPPDILAVASGSLANSSPFVRYHSLIPHLSDAFGTLSFFFTPRRGRSFLLSVSGTVALSGTVRTGCLFSPSEQGTLEHPLLNSCALSYLIIHCSRVRPPGKLGFTSIGRSKAIKYCGISQCILYRTLDYNRSMNFNNKLGDWVTVRRGYTGYTRIQMDIKILLRDLLGPRPSCRGADTARLG